MRCVSRWAFALGFCTLLIMLSGWSALGARSPLAKPPKPDTLISAPLISAAAEPLAIRNTLAPPAAAESDSPTSQGRTSQGGAQKGLTVGELPAGRSLGPEAQEPQKGARPADERALWDIMELRREHGDLFSGTLFEELALPGSEDEFLKALRSAASSHKNAPASWTTSACEASYSQQIQREQANADGNGELVRTLRLAGRQLDVKAADLEDAAQYQKADRLRVLARRLRRQARDLEPSPPLSPPSQANRSSSDR